jgi:hypothetical protein
LSVKLIMTWDIIPEREQEYFEFVVREFIPGVQRLGFMVEDAWATVFGDQPQIQVGAVYDSYSEAKTKIQSADWISLQNRLLDYVKNYQHKLVPIHPGFQF